MFVRLIELIGPMEPVHTSCDHLYGEGVHKQSTYYIDPDGFNTGIPALTKTCGYTGMLINIFLHI